MRELLTAKEVSESLHCSVAKINKLRKKGLLAGVKFGKSFLYDAKDVERLINNEMRFSSSLFEKLSNNDRLQLEKDDDHKW